MRAPIARWFSLELLVSVTFVRHEHYFSRDANRPRPIGSIPGRQLRNSPGRRHPGAGGFGFFGWLLSAPVCGWMKPERFGLSIERCEKPGKRAFHPGQPSVFFSILTWGTIAIGGLNEITLRMPSLIASSIAAIGVYRLARRFCDPHQSLLACAFFATYSTVAFAADARPYALALMAAVWSILMLIRWCETGKLAYGFASVLLVALSIYVHYLCAIAAP
jgi:hypothetical protein